MEWFYDVSPGQWSAFGAFWGGLAQVGLVFLGVYAGQQWFRQKRVEGLHALISECLQIIHDLDVAVDIGRAMVSYKGVQEQQFQIIGEKYIQLMGVATRSRYYDDAVANAITEHGNHIRDLLRAYDRKRDNDEALKEGGGSEEERKEYIRIRREAQKILFRTESDPWHQVFVDTKEKIIRTARKASWGKETL
jgi:hypothetical protein